MGSHSEKLPPGTKGSTGVEQEFQTGQDADPVFFRQALTPPGAALNMEETPTSFRAVDFEGTIRDTSMKRPGGRETVETVTKNFRTTVTQLKLGVNGMERWLRGRSGVTT